MKPLISDGIKYTKQEVKSLLPYIVTIRDITLKANNFEEAVILSHIHAVLYYYIENADE